MSFKIGFPVDAGIVDLSFIVTVQLAMTDMHFCTEGGASGLRENSGAAYVFSRASFEVQEKYRYEFTPIPMPNSKTRPDNLSDVGYSDSVACALAIKQHIAGKQALADSPLLLVSCSFVPQPKKHRLQKIILEKVTHKDATQARESLDNKWQAACKNNALALILHEQDAKLLANAKDVQILPLTTQVIKDITLKKTKNTPIISCKSNQWPQLLHALDLSPKTPGFIKVMALFFCTLAVLYGIYFKMQQNPNTKAPQIEKKPKLIQKTNKKIHLALFIQELTNKVKVSDLYFGKGVEFVVQQMQKIKTPLAKHQDLLLANLSHQDMRIRVVTAIIIGEMGVKGRFAEKTLAKVAQHPLGGSPAVKAFMKIKPQTKTIIHALGNNSNRDFLALVKEVNINTVKAEIIPLLWQKLKYQNQEVKIAITELISRLDPIPTQAIPYLIDNLQLSSGALINSTSKVLTLLGKNAMPAIIKAFKAQPQRRSLFLDILDRQDKISPQIIPVFIESFVHDKMKRIDTRKKLLLKTPSELLLPALLKHLAQSSNRHVREALLSILVATKAHAKSFALFSPLMELFQDYRTDFKTKLSILSLMGDIKARTEDKPKLIAFLQKSFTRRTRLNKQIIATVCKIRTHCQPPIELRALQFFIKDSDFHHSANIPFLLQITLQKIRKELILLLKREFKRKNVIYTLGEMGAHAKNAVPHILPFLQDTSKEVQILTMEALAKINDFKPQTKTLLAIVSDDKHYAAQIVAIRMIQRLKIKEALPILQKLSKHSFWAIRAKAIIAISKIEQDIKPLLRGLDDANSLVRNQISQELMQRKSEALPAIPTLIDRLNYPLPPLQKILKSVHKKSHIEFLEKVLSHKDRYIRREGVIALGKLGTMALPQLLEILNKETENEVLENLVKALSNMDHKAESTLKILRKKIQSVSWETAVEIQKAINKMRKSSLK